MATQSHRSNGQGALRRRDRLNPVQARTASWDEGGDDFWQDEQCEAARQVDQNPAVRLRAVVAERRPGTGTVRWRLCRQFRWRDRWLCQTCSSLEDQYRRKLHDPELSSVQPTDLQ